MLYIEFIQNTGCVDNDHNYEVYKNLEVLYMNSDVSKETIYEYGKKLVDNSKSPEQIAFEENLNAEIKSLQEELKRYREEIKRYTEYHRNRSDKKDLYWKNQLEWSRSQAKRARNRIAELRWIIEG